MQETDAVRGGEKTIWECPLQGGRTDTTGCSHAIDQGVDCIGTTSGQFEK